MLKKPLKMSLNISIRSSKSSEKTDISNVMNPVSDRPNPTPKPRESPPPYCRYPDSGSKIQPSSKSAPTSPIRPEPVKINIPKNGSRRNQSFWIDLFKCRCFFQSHRKRLKTSLTIEAEVQVGSFLFTFISYKTGNGFDLNRSNAFFSLQLTSGFTSGFRRKT